MNLSLRLNEVKNMVCNCDTVCDVGCDHGYISIALIEEEKCKKVIACDINIGPLEAAKVNIACAGLTESIETRLSDGLHKVDISDNADAIVIAGMGGALMARILEEGKDVVMQASQLVLQPQSEIFLVRKWLRENGYNIVRESCVLDAGKYYFLIDARQGKSPCYDADIQKIYDTYSEYLINTKNPVFMDYLKRGIEINNGYMSAMIPEKRSSLQEKNDIMNKVISMME